MVRTAEFEKLTLRYPAGLSPSAHNNTFSPALQNAKSNPVRNPFGR